MSGLFGGGGAAGGEQVWAGMTSMCMWHAYQQFILDACVCACAAVNDAACWCSHVAAALRSAHRCTQSPNHTAHNTRAYMGLVLGRDWVITYP